MSPQVTAAVIAASVSFLTLIGTLVAQWVGRRATSQQLDRTLAEQRIRTLNERFATAAGQLGDDKPPAVRLAGVYAMAGLADDWSENRQTCVDVLCAYLRMPYEPDPGREVPGPERLAFRASREVRHTVIRVITAHLKAGAAVPWQGLNYDFTGVVFDGGDFGGAVFAGRTVDFGSTVFSGGTVDFGGAMFTGPAVNFAGAVFSGGIVDFRGTGFSGGTISFANVVFSDARVYFARAGFSTGTVEFRGAKFSGGTVSFAGAEFSGGTIDFTGARFLGGGQIDFQDAKFCGGTVYFRSTEFSGRTVLDDGTEFSGIAVRFNGAEFSDGTVDFTGAAFVDGTVLFTFARFSGGTVDFTGAEFLGGEVDFTTPRDWACPPRFPWADTPPPRVHLPAKEDQSQA